jgi:uncharacterized membrane protein HdeD (DUF308 family)
VVDLHRGLRGATSWGQVDSDALRNNRGGFVALGIALLALGFLAIVSPFVALLFTTILLGWLMVLAGLVEGYHALRNRAWVGSGWELVSALVQLVGGALVVAFPVTGKLALTLILAVYFVAEGILEILLAAQHRGVDGSGWLVFDGLLSFVLGILILMHWPGVAVWALGLLLGIHLAASGVSMLLLGLRARPAAGAG